MRSHNTKLALASVVVLIGVVFGFQGLSSALEAKRLYAQNAQAIADAADRLKKVDAKLRAHAAGEEAARELNLSFLDEIGGVRQGGGADGERVAQELALFSEAKDALDLSISAMRGLRGEEGLTPEFVAQTMKDVRALEPYAAIYGLLKEIGDAGWQAQNGQKSLEEKRGALVKAMNAARAYSTVDAVCSQAFGQLDGFVQLHCMDMRLARPVVLMVEPAQYSSASLPFNGRLPVVDRGVQQYTLTHANAFNSWQSTEMIPTFEVVSDGVMGEHKKRVSDAENEFKEGLQRTKDAIAIMHREINRYRANGANASSAATAKRYAGYSSILEAMQLKGGAIDFENMVYPVDEDGPIRLRDGEYSPSEGGIKYRFSEFKKLDVNRDGQEDYVVSLVADYGGMSPMAYGIRHFLAAREDGKVRIVSLGYSEADISEVEIEGSSIVIWPQVVGSDIADKPLSEVDWEPRRLGRDKVTVYSWRDYQLIKESPSQDKK